MTRSRPTDLSLVIGGTVIAFVAGAATASLWLQPALPATLSGAQEVEDLPVTMQSFDDARSVNVAVAPASTLELQSPIAGRITAFDCSPSATMTSGASNISVDGIPLINLGTRVPLWRDLTIGDSGADVQALQDELVRLGYPVEPDGVLGEASLDATASLLAAGASEYTVTEAILQSRFVWIPAPATVVSSCNVAMGKHVETGVPLLEVAGPPADVRVERMPNDLLPGDRTLNIDEVSAALDGEGRVPDPADRGAISATASVRAGVASGGQNAQVSGSVRLANPVSVAAVPPSGVYAIAGRGGCVLADGRGVAVQIVGSQLGQTFVTFDDGPAPRTVRATPGEDAPPCR